MGRVRLRNQLETNIQRLDCSLEVVNIAGIRKPVYSNDQTVKDDPDFSISPGADGIERKLEIGESVTDITEVSGELRSRQYHVEQLLAMNVGDVTSTPFKYQLSPSLPVEKGGPARSMIVILTALLEGMVACGGTLLDHAVMLRKQEVTSIGQQLV